MVNHCIIKIFRVTNKLVVCIKLWSNRNIWIILSGEFIAGLGLWLGIIGNLEFLQAKVDSDFLKSLILSTGIIFGLAFGPLAGKVADQYEKKKILNIASFGRMVSVLFMFMALYFDSIIFLIFFAISIQICAAFYFPALQSTIPLVVKGPDLITMNGAHMNINTVARILGTTIAGTLLLIMPLWMLYAGSFVAYFFLFLFTMTLNIKEEPKVEKVGKSKGSFKEVLPVIKSYPVVTITLILAVIPTLFLGGFNIMVISVSTFYENTSVIKSIIYAVEGMTFMIGAFFIKRVRLQFNEFSIMFFSAFMIGLAQLLLYFVEHIAIIYISFGVLGFFVGCLVPVAVTIFQTKMPKEFHGRFFSFRNMVDRVMFQVVLLSTGMLLDLVGLKIMVLIFGTIGVCTTSTLFFYYRKYQKSSKVQKISA